jgi:hypothetical protein
MPTPKSAASLTKFDREARCNVEHISSAAAAILLLRISRRIGSNFMASP